VQILVSMLGVVTTIFAYALLFSGVYKVFTIGNDLAEIKKLLGELVRQREAAPRGLPDVVSRE
jgi:hypothetical protein